MFVENQRKIEGKFYYLSYVHRTKTECKVLIDTNDKETRVIVFQKYMHEGTSPTNCYEDIATSIYYEQFSKRNIKDIQWFLYYVGANKIVPMGGNHLKEWQLCPRVMFHMVMDWKNEKFENAKFNTVSEEKLHNILDVSDLSYDLFWSN